MQSHSSATPIPAVASLRIDSDRLARMWAMTPEERVQAARQGRLSLGRDAPLGGTPFERGGIGRR